MSLCLFVTDFTFLLFKQVHASFANWELLTCLLTYSKGPKSRREENRDILAPRATTYFSLDIPSKWPSGKIDVARRKTEHVTCRSDLLSWSVVTDFVSGVLAGNPPCLAMCGRRTEPHHGPTVRRASWMTPHHVGCGHRRFINVKQLQSNTKQSSRDSCSLRVREEYGITARLIFGRSFLHSLLRIKCTMQYFWSQLYIIFTTWYAAIWCVLKNLEVHRVSKKLCKIVFVRTSSNFHQFW